MSVRENIFKTEVDKSQVHLILSGSVQFLNKKQISSRIYELVPFFSVQSGYALPHYKYLESFRNPPFEDQTMRTKYDIKHCPMLRLTEFKDYDSEFEDTLSGSL